MNVNIQIYKYLHVVHIRTFCSELSFLIHLRSKNYEKRLLSDRHIY